MSLASNVPAPLVEMMLRSETEATVASTVPPSTYGPSVNTAAFTFAISNDGADTPVIVHESPLRVPLVPDAL